MSDPTPDSIIRKDIKRHFQWRKQLETTINQYENIIRENPNIKENLAWQIFRRKHGNNIIFELTRDQIFVERAARISIWKEKYNKEKDYMNSIIEQIENDTLSCTEAQDDSMFEGLKQNQYHILLKIVPMSDEYTYDKYVETFEQNRNKKHYFTYIEEDLLLESLRLWKKCLEKQNEKCICRVCALIHLDSLAHALAENKNKTLILKSWNVGAWLCDFEIRHKKYIHENFPSEEECKDDPKVAPQIPDVRSGKKSEDAEDMPSTSKSQPSSTSTKGKPSSLIQRTASFKIPSDKKYEYAKDAEPSTSKSQPSSSYTKAEPRFPIQVPGYVGNKEYWREQIKKFVKSFEKVYPAAEEVINNNENEKKVAKEYNITDIKDNIVFVETVKIWKDRNNYYDIRDNIKEDFQAVSAGNTNLFTVARKYDIKNYLNLFEQYKKYEETGPSNEFIYDRYTFYGTFKYSQLHLIRKKFIKWSNENNLKKLCNCRTCALEHLLDEVNASNIKFNLLYLLGFHETKPLKYRFKKWFLEVNMMLHVYSTRMKRIYFSMKDCKKDQPQPSSSRTGFTDSSNLYVASTSATQSSSSYTEEEILDQVLDMESQTGRKLDYSQASVIRPGEELECAEDQPSSSTSVSQPSSPREETLESLRKRRRVE